MLSPVLKPQRAFGSKDWAELGRARVRTAMRLQTHVICHMKQSLKLTDLNDEWLAVLLFSSFMKILSSSLVVNMRKNGKSTT